MTENLAALSSLEMKNYCRPLTFESVLRENENFKLIDSKETSDQSPEAPRLKREFDMSFLP
jgi:hypothetical protein